MMSPFSRKIFSAAFLPLLTPVILLGGIVSGIFTPTEAAAVAAIYALHLALLPVGDLLRGALLAVAADTGTAVMCNLPFARAALFKAVAGKAVPEWAKEFDAPTWGQFFLKYLIARPEVNVVIPGTDRVDHMQDNLAAGRTRLPDAALRRRMVDFIGNV